MSSEINNQAVEIDQLILPYGTGITTNTNSSLLPIKGSMCVDVVNYSQAYIGTGTSWVPASGGVNNSFTTEVTGITLSLAGQASFTGCSLRGVYIASGSQNKAVVTLTVSINASIAVTAAGDWVSPAGVIPVLYRPVAGALYFPCTCNGSVGGIVNTYFEINSSGSGSIIIHNPASSGNMSFYTLSCSYPV